MLEELCRELGFPDEATAYLSESMGRLAQSGTCLRQMKQAAAAYMRKDEAWDLQVLADAAEKTGLNRYTVDLLFLLICAELLKPVYAQKKLPYALYLACMCDLRYKLMECKEVYDCWGTFVLDWFRGFFLCERFQLGRLQYERARFPYADYRAVLKTGDVVCNCHIPSSGPLSGEAVLASFKEAYQFYEAEFKDGLMPLVCSSWLLYPPHYEVFPPGSNLRHFFKLFDVIDQWETKENPDFWRIFRQNFNAEINNWPQATELQRRFKAFLSNGNCMGRGYGILLFDGHKIVNTEHINKSEESRSR